MLEHILIIQTPEYAEHILQLCLEGLLIYLFVSDDRVSVESQYLSNLVVFVGLVEHPLHGKLIPHNEIIIVGEALSKQLLLFFMELEDILNETEFVLDLLLWGTLAGSLQLFLLSVEVLSQLSFDVLRELGFEVGEVIQGFVHLVEEAEGFGLVVLQHIHQSCALFE